MLIYLVGFMGSGKTTAGKKLARKLNYKFIDLDSMIEIDTKLSISAYFEKFGEERFRKIEKIQLNKTFDLKDTVISTGGGAPCYFTNMEEINQNGMSIYLKADIPLIINRLENGKNDRPLIRGRSHDELVRFIENSLLNREAYYSKAKLIIDARNLNTEELMFKILKFED